MNGQIDNRTNYQEHGSRARIDAGHKGSQPEQKPTYRKDKPYYPGDEHYYAPDDSSSRDW